MWANKAESACRYSSFFNVKSSGPHPFPELQQTPETHIHVNTNIQKSSNALLTTSQRQSSNCCQ